MFAFKNKHHYHDLDLNFTMSGNSNIVLAVHDQRKEMLTNGRSPDFVGYMRSGVGIPFPISTASGKALADDICGTISKALSKRGFRVTTVSALSSETHQQVLDKMKAANAGKPVILHLEEWHNDCYQMVWCNFNLVLQVYDETGNFLGQKPLNGSENLGGSFWNPAKHARKSVPEFFRKEMEALFNSPEITAIL